ncbi:hypothetical protein [Izhakiella australiensis]|nr:hypothetical protein [Izhakiella australiensis]
MIFFPIRTYGQDWKNLDIRTVREINTHNEVWQRLCGEPTN